MDEAPKSVAEVADLLNVSRPTIRRMIVRGDLQAIHVGPRLLRVPASEVERVLTPSQTSEE
jgi:excisionase family DNA binding protein